MNVDDVKKEMIANNQNPDDFRIVIENDAVKITPKWFYEGKRIAKEQDKPIIEDVNVTAQTIVYTTQDVVILADTISHLITEVTILKDKLEVIKNG